MSTAHTEYAFNPRQGAMSNGSYHAILDQPLHVGRLRREAGDPLCKPARKFWGLNPGNRKGGVNCARCLSLMQRYGVSVEAVSQ